ncbi:acetate uptake transporter [Actinocrispum wychmicini]|uniref:Uncharacterized protein n=1 Tax=Actinocrispum wychmicini TaxID=1213861 RepID=A0A4R2IIM8_9PSEU|nr:GPR1/FUN34/YaaH family transporter [Actinocrispum wychmicini]TCO44774.1 hypothetical protein EV192_12231 [Actinocrispum wychmicini]
MTTTATRNATTTAVTATSADPGPLGLAGFAAPFLVLSFVNAGVLDVSALVATVVPIGLFYGGLTQILAGILEFRRGNTFGVTVFATYGAFWLAFAGYTEFFSTNASAAATGMFVLVFAIVTAVFAVAAARIGKVTFVVFLLLALTFADLTIASFASSREIQHVGGWLGVLAAVAALYASAATLVNDTWKRAATTT